MPAGLVSWLLWIRYTTCVSLALNLNESLNPRPSQLNAQTVNLLIWQAKLEAALQNKPINL